jgi:hypothetical protein
VYDLLLFVAFFGVIAFTGVAAPAGGKRYVGPTFPAMAAFAVFLAFVDVVLNGFVRLSLVLLVLAVVASINGYRYYRAYNT